MKKYLIGLDKDTVKEWTPILINATNEEEAVLLFCDYYATQDELFAEHLYDKTINLSFAERFWLQTVEENNEFNENGDVLIDDVIFRQRVTEYFKEFPFFSDSYLQYYFDEEKDSTNFRFPDEMIRFIWLKECKAGEWANVHALNLDDVPRLN